MIKKVNFAFLKKKKSIEKEDTEHAQVFIVFSCGCCAVFVGIQRCKPEGSAVGTWPA